MLFKVFHALGVVTAEVKSDTLYSVIAIGSSNDPVDFTNPNIRFDVDMTRTPNRTSNWAKIQLDDRGVDASGKEITPYQAVKDLPGLAITSLGTGKLDMPALGLYIGGVYFEHALYTSLVQKYLPNWKPTVEGVQLTSVVCLDDSNPLAPVLRRYHGFHVTKVVGTTANDITVTLAAPDNAKNLTIKRSDILLDAPADAYCGLAPLAKDPKVGESGGLFVELVAAVALGARGPKVPVGFGS